MLQIIPVHKHTAIPVARHHQIGEKQSIEDCYEARNCWSEENDAMNFLDYVFGKNKKVNAAMSEGRYQIFRQDHNGSYVAEYRTDYAPKAVDVFLRTAPIFDGGEIRLWDHQTKRLVAAIEWRTEKTEVGFFIHVRSNIFYDRVLASIARQIRKAEKIVGAWDDEDEREARRHSH